jgi:hypothetical protein
MSKLTGQHSEAAAYEFTTVRQLVLNSVLLVDRRTAHHSAWSSPVQWSEDSDS